MSEQITVEREVCDGYGNCVFVAPEVFDLDEANLVVLLRPDVTPGTREDVLLAIAECPTRAIALSEGS